jgi:hypothetical protein
MKGMWIFLFGLLLLAAPATVQAQFTYTTNAGAITVTGYPQPDDTPAVVSPPLIDSARSQLSGIGTDGGANVFLIYNGAVEFRSNWVLVSSNEWYNFGVPAIGCGGKMHGGLCYAVVNAFAGTGLGMEVALTNAVIVYDTNCIRQAIYPLNNINNLEDFDFGPDGNAWFLPWSSTNMIARTVFLYNTNTWTLGGTLTLDYPLYYPGGLVWNPNDQHFYANALSYQENNYPGGDGIDYFQVYKFDLAGHVTPVVATTVQPPSGAYYCYGWSSPIFLSNNYANIVLGMNWISEPFDGVTNNMEQWVISEDVDVTIPSSIDGLPVTSIGDGAFSNCYNITNVTIPFGVTNIGAFAFLGCNRLTDVTIPSSVTTIQSYAFFGASLTNVTIPSSCTGIGYSAFDCTTMTAMTGVYFEGNAPGVNVITFAGDTNASAYYLPGSTGWGPDFGGLPALLWNPLIDAKSLSLGLGNNQFGFNITGTSNILIVVEACTNLASPVWTPLQTLTLTNGLFYFSDPQWTNYPGRFYRISSP